MMDHRTILPLVLSLPFAMGCGAGNPSSVESQAPSNAGLVRVADDDASDVLHAMPNVAQVAAVESARDRHSDELSTVPSTRAARESDEILPPEMDWDAVPDGLSVPPADRAPRIKGDLREPPLPPLSEAESSKRAAAGALGELWERPAIEPTEAEIGEPVTSDSDEESESDEAPMPSPEDLEADPSDAAPATDSWLDGEDLLTPDLSDVEAPQPNEIAPSAEISPEGSAQELPVAPSSAPPQAPSAAAIPPRPMPTRLSRAQIAEMAAVSRLADAHSKRGFELAGRNALYSSKSEFLQALGMVAQGLDAIEQGAGHVEAMTAGLKALEESNDFVARSSRVATQFDATEIARPHHTKLLQERETGSTTAMEALQLYYGFAQRHLEFAAGRQPAGSMALHGLGKVYTALAKTKGDQRVAAEPKAIVFFQAALLTDGRNYLAANELGVLLASYGKYAQAKAALLQSLRSSGQPVAWRNLAVVHSHMGEPHLAQLALGEAQRAAERGIDGRMGPLGLSGRPFDVQWVDPKTFAHVQEPAAPAAPAASVPPSAPATSAPPASPPAPAAEPRPAVSSVPPNRVMRR